MCSRSTATTTHLDIYPAVFTGDCLIFLDALGLSSSVYSTSSSVSSSSSGIGVFVAVVRSVVLFIPTKVLKMRLLSHPTLFCFSQPSATGCRSSTDRVIKTDGPGAGYDRLQRSPT